MSKFKKCGACKRYTLADACPDGHGETVDPHPPAFSFPDRYGEERRATKRKRS